MLWLIRQKKRNRKLSELYFCFKIMSELLEQKELRDKVMEQIKSVFDPEIPVNIYELGLIYEVNIYPVDNVYVQMTLTSPSCPSAQELPAEVETKIKSIEQINKVDVEIVFDPPWDQSMMSDEARLELGFM